jgi:hypothetical protein
MYSPSCVLQTARVKTHWHHSLGLNNAKRLTPIPLDLNLDVDSKSVIIV